MAETPTTTPGKKAGFSGTKILRCKCSHEMQDMKYGDGMRVHNRKADKAGAPAWRCTVCTNETIA